MPVTEIIYDNWGNFYEVDRTYDELIVRYEIETSAGIEIVDEPVGWDAVDFKHSRDPKYGGFNYELTGGDFTLKFDDASGKEFIDADYDQFGIDAKILFRKVVNDGTTDYIEFEGRLNLSTRRLVNYRVEAVIEKNSVHQKIKSRISTKVNLDQNRDLDENDIPTYQREGLALLGQAISEKFESSKTVVRAADFTEIRTDDSIAFVFFDFRDPSVNTIKTFLGTDLSISGDLNGTYDDSHAIFKFEASGKYTVDIDLDFETHLKINPRFLAFGKKVKQAEMYVQVVINPKTLAELPGGRRVYTIKSVPLFVPNTENVDYPRITEHKVFEDIEVEAGESMTIMATLIYRHNANKLKSVVINVKQRKAVLKISGYSEQEPSIAYPMLIKTMIDALFLRVTGIPNNVKSNFYSKMGPNQAVDGCGANRLVLNGAALRGAPYTKFPFTTTIADMLQSMHAIDCIGMGYEWDAENEQEIIRIEPLEYFFADVQIMLLNSVGDYREETAKDLIHNKINIGYNKYKEEEENAYDEIHAYHEYQTPVENEENEYTQISKYNASGYLVELTRRVQFEETPQDTTSYDDDIFIIHAYKETEGILPLWGAVTEEPFDQVSGILDPETTINMTITPKRMLMAHSKWLMGSLLKKDPSRPIRNTFVKQNKDFTTTLKSTECPRGDESLLPLRAAEDILIGAFRPDLDAIYSPEWIYFTTRMPMTRVRYLMNALRGLSEVPDNYGYIAFPNDKGAITKGYVYEISYARDKEEVSFKLLKKKSQ